MAFLHEKIDVLRENGYISDMPTYISDNINPAFELRPYQITAFENFITHFESPKCPHPTQVLFHMATGSGKTLIMAGLMLYLYRKGYRNFLFFVNLSTIVKKTEDNFLNAASSKYLFAEEIVLDGERIAIKKVSNFQSADPDAINICFSTTQGLHTDIWVTKENGISFDDFDDVKTVLISDEAHHLNVSTKKFSQEEKDNYHSWEQTVKSIFDRNSENILLEFTATCDLANPQIRAEYENKIIFDYPLHKFRADLYSKEIKTLRSDMDIMDRAIQALVLSQYRLKVFQDNHLSIKPVVLFKSAKIADSKAFMATFIEVIKKLDGSAIERIYTLIDNPTMHQAYDYFLSAGITFDMLAQELREDFSEEHCVSVNDDKEADKKQILLNSLEDASNPYRAIFEVKKLDEGWDVLNLFDIVRLYETRQSGGKSISPATVSEAQLIGRGARYCPFKINDEQPKYQRKYDNDVENGLRICEELYYHCQNDSRYIGELHNALREIGIDPDKTVTKHYILKDEFKQDDLYKKGLIFINDRVVKSRAEVNELLPSVRNKVYQVTLATGQSGEDAILDDGQESSVDHKSKTKLYTTTIGEIANINYAIVNKALAKVPVYKFNTLKSRFPNLKSTREFITSTNYLGDIKIEIRSKYDEPSVSILSTAVASVLTKIAASISAIEEEYEGTKDFRAVNIHDIFRDKAVNYTNIVDGGIGVSQNDITVPAEMRIDLKGEDWFTFTDNYGTSEEKAFVSYFRDYVDKLKTIYSKIYLMRNERQMHIYSFDGGERFEPDYVLFLQKDNEDGFEQMQVFIEPKGTHLVESDKWKEDFLLQLKENAIPVKTFVDDNKYHIWGFHFFNRDVRGSEFSADLEMLQKTEEHLKVLNAYAKGLVGGN
ncbi:DEAD/DEAH box helicase family protein [Faecalicatena contorta]|uniref:DEAD/DEAH box helicase family protein n=1 Tax=Faecalicatena contorta TaxID=39482 RepID=UPI001F257C1B|nr:DEAD/DEAH box helicase family protein [Faecalicatena contorta]MCF2683201.1 DEAD/DEAH box helicase family protein [Faecalicatena contorta]